MECGTKVKHPTREDAVEHLKQLVWVNHSRKQDDRSKGLNVYPCGQCGCFHVGHTESQPLVWHYTIVDPYLDRILASDALKPAKPRRPPRAVLDDLTPEGRAYALSFFSEPVPLLWFSRNPEWEYSVIKIRMSSEDDDRKRTVIGRAMTEVMGGGLLRFGVYASYAKLRWSDYLSRNPTTKELRRLLTKHGNPTEWLATDERIPLDKVRAIQVYFRGTWTDVADVDDAAFDAYLDERPDIYSDAARRLATLGDEHRPLDEAERILMADVKYGNVEYLAS